MKTSRFCLDVVFAWHDEKVEAFRNFVGKAPEEKVREIRDRVAEIETQMITLKQNLEALK